jgi:hypothetical protein
MKDVVRMMSSTKIGSPAFMVISFAYLDNWSEAEII